MSGGRTLRALALAVLGILVAAALLADVLAAQSTVPREALQTGLGLAGAAELWAWWALAARHVLAVVITASVLGAVWGGFLGALAIYGTGGIVGALPRLAGFTGAFPGLLLVGLFRLGDPSRGLLALLFGLSLVRCLEVAQLVRAEVLSTLLGGYVEASRALGASRRWQWRMHVLPRVARPLSTNLLQGASSLIGLEAALSFVGLGLPASLPSWGGGLAVLARAGGSSAFCLAALSIGLTSAALYGLGMSLEVAPQQGRRSSAAPLVALGAAQPRS